MASSSQSEMLDPYYMHPSYNPGIALVSPRLSGSSNYQSWSRSMTVALRSKNKIKFVDGTLPKPDASDAKFLAWDHCNTMVMS